MFFIHFEFVLAQYLQFGRFTVPVIVKVASSKKAIFFTSKEWVLRIFPNVWQNCIRRCVGLNSLRKVLEPELAHRDTIDLIIIIRILKLLLYCFNQNLCCSVNQNIQQINKLSHMFQLPSHHLQKDEYST